MSISSGLLNKTAKVIIKDRTGGTANTFGETAYTESDSISSLKIALQPVREELSFTLRGTTYVVRNVAYCNYRTDINPGDLLEIDSVQYLIVSVQNDGGRDHHTKLFVTKA